MPIVNNTTNAVAMTVLPNAPIDPVTGLRVPTIAVHTAGGVSIIRHDGTVTSHAFTGSISGSLVFVQPGLLAYSNNNNNFAFQLVRVADVSGPTFTSAFSGSNTSTVGLSGQGLQGIRRGTFATRRPSGLGTAVNLSKTGDTVTPGGLLRADVANAYNTGYLFGDIRRAYLADVGAGSVGPAPELIDTSLGVLGSNSYNVRGTVTAVGDGFYQLVGNDALNQTIASIDGIFTFGKTYRVRVEITQIAASSVAIHPSMDQNSGLATSVGTFNTVGVHYATISPDIAARDTLTVIGPTMGNSVTLRVSVKEVVADRSYKTAGANIFGTLTRTPVAEGAQLVAWSNWSAVNNVQEPYSADLDFGTGEWTCSAWMNVPATLPVANFPVIGSNVLPSSTFNASDWNVTGADATHIATFSGGTLRYQSDTTTPQLSVNAPGGLLVAERMYRITVTCSAWVSGSVKMFEGAYGQLVVGNVGTFTAVMRTNGTSFSITRNSTNVDLTLSSIEIREVSPALLADRSAAAGPAVRMAVDGAGRLVAAASDGTTTRTVTTTQTYNTGTWLKARANYRAGRLSISVNGIEVASANGAPLATLNNSNAVLTIGNSFALDASFPGSIALLKFSAGVPTSDQALFMFEQEKQMFRAGAQVCLPDANALVDLTYDDATDKWIAVSATNESEFSGLVRTSVTPAPAGSYIKATATSGVQLLARSTTTPGVDVTMPAYGLRSELVKRAEAAAKMKQDTLVFDFDTIGFTAAMTSGSNQITASAITGTPFVGMAVTGTGVPANTTIAGINGTTYTLSANATATGSNAVGQAGFDLPTGYTARVVYSAGQQRREGSTRDYTRLFDGFREQIRFAVTPGASTWVQIHAVKEIA